MKIDAGAVSCGQYHQNRHGGNQRDAQTAAPYLTEAGPPVPAFDQLAAGNLEVIALNDMTAGGISRGQRKIGNLIDEAGNPARSSMDLFDDFRSESDLSLVSGDKKTPFDITADFGAR